MNNLMKRWLPDVLAVVLFAVLAFAYFYPADTEGRILYQHDTSAGAGAGQEAKEYFEKTGERTRWTNSLFGGMPTYQISPSYNSTDTLTVAENTYHLWLPDYVWHLFAYLLGFYILLRAFDFKQYLAALGSIFWAFSTYFLIIIAAGHMWKVMALAYLPPLIAGIVLAYRGRYMAGLVVTAIFAALEVHANHVQMTYYYLFIILAMVVAFAIEAIRQKRMAQWLKATGVCLVGGLLGVLVNISNLYHTWDYSKQTMRGGSELKAATTGGNSGGGLDRDYITQYSYGIGETWSLLIPDVEGGASMRADAEQGTALYPLGESSAAKKAANTTVTFPNGQTAPASYLFDQMPQYWGDGGTMGPVYVGAFVCLLFVLSLFVVRGPMKWALLVVTLLSIMLSWGKNFMGLTDFFIDYVPMYAKFRTVESILVIAEFTIPLLAMLGLKKVIDNPQLLNQRLAKQVPLTPLSASVLLTGGVLLLFALLPSMFFDFIRPEEREWLGQFGAFAGTLEDVRRSIFTSSCWRSLGFIAVGTILLWLYATKRLKALPTVAAIAVVCLVDLWTVNKNYLNDSMFRDASIKEKTHQKTALDNFLLEDRTPDYRVLNMPYPTERLSTVFNENQTSYYHKSVGGYHAAKLQRYQDLIDSCLYQEMMAINQIMPQAAYQLDSVPTDQFMPVLNMLNTRYVVVRTQEGIWPMQNNQAYGNAWFVDHVDYVANANEELAALHQLELRHEAVADKRFEQELGQPAALDSAATVHLDSYEPNRLKYTVESQTGGVLVFSEIYYPDWTATVDGKPVELGRVNYVLRAMHIDGGKHQVELSFEPKSVKTTETIAYVSLVVMVLLILTAIALGLKRRQTVTKKP
ncbi:MAG: YfhO family protein [Prevotella sp.]|nr:YfhO family protein [Prevotella sp.]